MCVDACGCLWMHVDALWMHVDALWTHVDACARFVVACGCLQYLWTFVVVGVRCRWLVNTAGGSWRLTYSTASSRDGVRDYDMAAKWGTSDSGACPAWIFLGFLLLIGSCSIVGSTRQHSYMLRLAGVGAVIQAHDVGAAAQAALGIQ